MAERLRPRMRSPSQWPRANRVRFRWHCAVPCLRRTLADEHLGGDKRLTPPARARPRHPQRPARAQAGRQLTLQRSPALDVDRLVDGLVADAHGLVPRKVEPQAPGNLLRAPRHSPPPVLPASVPAPLPGHGRPSHRRPAQGGHGAGRAVLHIRPQRRAGGQLRPFRQTCRPLCVPLRRGDPIVQPQTLRVSASPPPPRGRVATQLARDRGRRPPQPACNLPHAQALRPQQRNLLPLGKRQIPPRDQP